jgi:hypothetical protein
MLMAMLLLQEVVTESDKQITWITWTASWVALGFLGLIGVAIIYYVFTKQIDLSGLISEPTGEASMSRFQLLIFTFVVAASLFLIVASKKPQPNFPDIIPNGILVLLGISSSSYLVSKGIQHSSPEGVLSRGPQVTIKGASNVTTFNGPDIQFQAEVFGLTDKSVTWSLDPPVDFGVIDATGLYTPPAKGTSGSKVTIKAASKEDVGITDTETITLT